MKNLILKTILPALIGITIISSCNKEKFAPLNGSVTIYNKNSEAILNKKQLEYIGSYHNESLRLIFSNFNWETNNIKQEFIDNLKSNDIQLKNYSEKYLQSRCKKDYKTNFVILKEKLSPESFSFIENSINLSYSIHKVSTYSMQINSLQDKARQEIKDIAELNVVLVTLEVLKNSAYFWLPKSVGGSGIGQKYILLHNNQQRDLVDFLAADGVSAGIGMLGVAAAGMLGPIGWGTLAIVAGESALSSGASLIF